MRCNIPIYDFECADHGEFEASTTFANADVKQPCPKCKKRCKRVARLYPANISYMDGMTKHPAVKDSENTKRYGHTV